MIGDADNRDKHLARRILLGLTILLVVAGVVIALTMPVAAGGIIETHFSPGMGLKSAAIIAFVVTIVLLVIFAIAAGDGLFGEIQFMFSAFFMLFFFLWLMIAWIF